MKVLLIIAVWSSICFSQWEAGGSFLIKKEIPQKGFSISIGRNLPYQGATFGLKVRFDFNFFNQTRSSITSKEKIISEEYILRVLGNYFFKNFSPYFGIGAGYSQFGVQELSDNSFLFSLLAGAGFPVGFFVPYIELQGVNYFSEQNFSGEGNLSSFQLRASAGICFLISTL
jgi:hypothetical protein